MRQLFLVTLLALGLAGSDNWSRLRAQQPIKTSSSDSLQAARVVFAEQSSAQTKLPGSTIMGAQSCGICRKLAAVADFSLTSTTMVDGHLSGQQWSIRLLFAKDSIRNALYRNNGDGTFTDVTEKAGVACGQSGDFGMGAAAADYDGDGRQDLYVTNYGHNVLFHNNGNGTFTDVTDKAGVGAPNWSTCATWFDYDNDGKLDLFVSSFVQYSGTGRSSVATIVSDVATTASPRL